MPPSSPYPSALCRRHHAPPAGPAAQHSVSAYSIQISNPEARTAPNGEEPDQENGSSPPPPPLHAALPASTEFPPYSTEEHPPARSQDSSARNVCAASACAFHPHRTTAPEPAYHQHGSRLHRMTTDAHFLPLCAPPPDPQPHAPSADPGIMNLIF